MQDKEPPKIVSSLSSQSREAAKDILFGSIAGVIGKAVEYPFDTVKVRLQAQPSVGPLTYSGPLDCFRQSIRQHGFWGLYRGISPPLFGAAVETSSLFFSVCCLDFNLRPDSDSTDLRKKPSKRPSSRMPRTYRFRLSSSAEPYPGPSHRCC